MHNAASEYAYYMMNFAFEAEILLFFFSFPPIRVSGIFDSEVIKSINERMPHFEALRHFVHFKNSFCEMRQPPQPQANVVRAVVVDDVCNGSGEKHKLVHYFDK